MTEIPGDLEAQPELPRWRLRLIAAALALRETIAPLNIHRLAEELKEDQEFLTPRELEKERKIHQL